MFSLIVYTFFSVSFTFGQQEHSCVYLCMLVRKAINCATACQCKHVWRIGRPTLIYSPMKWIQLRLRIDWRFRHNSAMRWFRCAVDSNSKSLLLFLFVFVLYGWVFCFLSTLVKSKNHVEEKSHMNKWMERKSKTNWFIADVLDTQKKQSNIEQFSLFCFKARVTAYVVLLRRFACFVFFSVALLCFCSSFSWFSQLVFVSDTNCVQLDMLLLIAVRPKDQRMCTFALKARVYCSSLLLDSACLPKY